MNNSIKKLIIFFPKASLLVTTSLLVSQQPSVAQVNDAKLLPISSASQKKPISQTPPTLPLEEEEKPANPTPPVEEEPNNQTPPKLQ